MVLGMYFVQYVLLEMAMLPPIERRARGRVGTPGAWGAALNDDFGIGDKGRTLGERVFFTGQNRIADFLFVLPRLKGPASILRLL
jgi:hypothetical protein